MADLRRVTEIRLGAGFDSLLNIADYSTDGATLELTTVCASHERIVDNGAPPRWEIQIAAFPVTHRKRLKNRRQKHIALDVHLFRACRSGATPQPGAVAARTRLRRCVIGLLRA